MSTHVRWIVGVGMLVLLLVCSFVRCSLHTPRLCIHPVPPILLQLQLSCNALILFFLINTLFPTVLKLNPTHFPRSSSQNLPGRPIVCLIFNAAPEVSLRCRESLLTECPDIPDGRPERQTSKQRERLRNDVRDGHGMCLSAACMCSRRAPGKRVRQTKG